MSSVEQRITAFRILGWVLRIVSVIILIGLFVDIVYLLPRLQDILHSFDVFSQQFIQAIPLVIAYAVLQWGSHHLFAQANEEQNNLEEKIVGYITSNERVSIDMLAKWTRIPHRKIADLVARLVAKALLKGYVIDIPSQTISRVPVGSGMERLTPPIVAVPQPPLQTPPNPTDEATRLKAKLYEIEVLKKQGRISEAEYNEIKDEVERKLVNLDTGTQVY